MVKINPADEFNALTIRGTYARPWGLGEHWLGHTWLGFRDEKAGVYQSQPTRLGTIYKRLRFLYPENVITPDREFVRMVFAQGVATWQDMSEDDKKYFRDLKNPAGMSGYNRFLSLWMKALTE